MFERVRKSASNGSINGAALNINGTSEDTTDSLIPKSQLKQAVREILAEMLGVHTSGSHQRKFYPTAKAWQELGYDCQQQLYDAVSSGLLRVGSEVEDRRKPQSKLPRYYFDIERCQKRLKQLPEKRKI